MIRLLLLAALLSQALGLVLIFCVVAWLTGCAPIPPDYQCERGGVFFGLGCPRAPP